MEIIRENPKFSLCGLNCCLCPRYHTDGASRCPGCGAESFKEQHPPCGIISCANRHGNVAYCFECADYPCQRYLAPNDKDSFISYLNRNEDMIAAKADLMAYMRVLTAREAILQSLLLDYNDGRSKSLFCVAVNRLPLERLQEILNHLEDAKAMEGLDRPQLARLARAQIIQVAEAAGISLALRK